MQVSPVLASKVWTILVRRGVTQPISQKRHDHKSHHLLRGDLIHAVAKMNHMDRYEYAG